MALYMMILHDSTTAVRNLSPDEIQRIVKRYNDWAAEVAQAGKLRGGHKLRDEGGVHLTKDAGKVVLRDGPYAEVKEIIGGYFIIEATSYDDMTQLCRDCPHLELGGRIEVREVEIV